MKKLLVAAVLAVAMLASGCGRIETGHVGVRTEFNKTVNTQVLQPGWYGAVLSSVDEHTAKEIEVKLDNLTPRGKDNLVLADFDVSLWYQPTPGKVGELVVKYTGMSPCDKGLCYPAFNLVSRVSQGVVFDAVSKYESLTIHTKRNDLEQRILEQLNKELETSDKGALRITKVVVRQIKTDPALDARIQEAVQMEKRIEAKNLEEQLAAAEARRLLAEADGIAKANNKINASLTDQLLKYKALDVQAQFAGQGTHTVLLPHGTPAIIGLK